MRRHKWGIWWLVLLAWNAAYFGAYIARGDYWWAAVITPWALFCGYMGYRDLTKVSRTVTITITPDMREWDAAMKRAMQKGKRKP